MTRPARGARRGAQADRAAETKPSVRRIAPSARERESSDGEAAPVTAKPADNAAAKSVADAEDAAQAVSRGGDNAAPATGTTSTGTQPAATTEPSELSGVSGTLRGEVIASPIDGSRIVITGDERDLAFIEQLLALAEGSTPSPDIEVFVLQHAKATALQPLLEGMAGAWIEQTVGQPGRAERFTISAEARSNSLIVAAAPKIMELIAALVERLDTDTGTSDNRFHTIALEHIRAAEAVAQIQPVVQRLNQMRGVADDAQASVEEIARANSVLVIGTPADIEEITRLIEAIDIEIPDQGQQFVRGDMIIIGLKNGLADDISKVLTDMIKAEQDAAREGGSAGGGGGAGGGRRQAGQLAVRKLKLTAADGRELPELDLEKPIRILPEKGTNSLIVYSTPKNNEALKEIVGVFDTLPLGADTEVRVYALKHATAETVATLLGEVFEKGKSALKRPAEGGGEGLEKGVLPPIPPGLAGKGLPYPVTVQHDKRSNVVLVVGRTDAITLASALISELDRPTMNLGVAAHIIPLKNLSASGTAEKLSELLKERLTALGGDSDAKRDAAIVQADDRSNSLIVMATDEVFAMVKQLATELDTATSYRNVDTRLRALKYADAAKLQSLLQELFDKKTEAIEASGVKSDSKDTLTVLADTRSNSLVFVGTRDYLNEANQLMTDMDRRFDPTVEFKLRPVKLNSAKNIATLLKDMVEKALAQKDSKLSGTPIHIEADGLSNTLLLAASKEDLVMLDRWVGILDRPNELGRMTRIIPLERGKAEDVATSVSDLFKGASGGSDGAGEDITISHDAGTNSVIAFGPPAILEDIADTVRRIDRTDPSGGAVVRMYKLQQADAESAGELLQNILEGRGGAVGGRGGGGSSEDAVQQVMLIWQQKNAESVDTFRAMRSQIKVIADIRTNSLVVMAPPDSMLLMDSLVAAIDIPPDSKKIRVFPLRNSDAEQMVEQLEKLFETSAGGGGTGGGGGSGEEGERVLTLGEGAAGGRQEISFSTDIRTNSVIAAGTPGYLDLVEDLILQLDSQDIAERKTIIYTPITTKAEDLASLITEYSDAEQARLEELGDDVSRARKLERQIVAIAGQGGEEGSQSPNRLILSYSPRMESDVLNVVRELDQLPPQVLIQVLILEVTLDNSLELGVEFAFQDLQFQRAGPNDTTTFDYVGGTDVNAVGSGGGFSFTITGADFNFLFHALQGEGRLNVLSRPQIVAMDNQEAVINVGQRIPFVSATSTTVAGQLQSQIQREDVGIKLTVTPTINPDGFVRLQLEQEVNDVTPSSVSIGEGVNVPITFNRVTNTTVMVKDNETVLLGGLITSREEKSESKVPLLGDIPGAGLLFRSQTDRTQRTELLVIITPKVIRTVEDYRYLSLEERDTTTVIPPETLANPLMDGMQLTPPPTPKEVQVQEEQTPADMPGSWQEIEPTRPRGSAPRPTPRLRDDQYGPIRPKLNGGGDPASSRPAAGSAGDGAGGVQRVSAADSYDVPAVLRGKSAEPAR